MDAEWWKRVAEEQDASSICRKTRRRGHRFILKNPAFYQSTQTNPWSRALDAGLWKTELFDLPIVE
jgi:hypothetical protein